jgi:hypothetical protein
MGQFALEAGQGLLSGLGRLGPYQISDTFGLGQVKAAIEEGPEGKFPRLSEASALF